jgi:hypothetical protein
MTRVATLAALLLLASTFLSATASHAADAKPEKIKTSGIKVAMIQTDDIKLPAEFQVSLYENLIEQLQQKSGLQHIYREGDRNADRVPDLVILHSTVQAFKQGSEEERNVTTVAGATSIKIHCVFTDKGGKSLAEGDITGKVWFLGGNLRATFDFAKKAADLTHQRFAPAT